MQPHTALCHSSRHWKRWGSTVNPLSLSLYPQAMRLTIRLQGTEPRRPSETMGFVHPESTIVLLFSYALASGHIGGDVAACTHQSESTS